jgi:hypothetical protein
MVLVAVVLVGCLGFVFAYICFDECAERRNEKKYQAKQEAIKSLESLENTVEVQCKEIANIINTIRTLR